METARLTARPAWQALAAHYADLRTIHLRELFAADPGRGERLVIDALGLYFDYSKNRVTDETVRLLVKLAEECGLRGKIDAMFAGEKINTTEKRAVLHTALRAPHGTAILVDGENVVPGVHEVLDRMADFSGRVRGGAWLSQARFCRAAIRHRYLPESRDRVLGLRLSAGQELQAAEPQGAERPLPERRSRTRRAGGSPPA